MRRFDLDLLADGVAISRRKGSLSTTMSGQNVLQRTTVACVCGRRAWRPCRSCDGEDRSPPPPFSFPRGWLEIAFHFHGGFFL